MPVPTPAPAPPPARGVPSTALVVGYVAVVSAVAVGALIVTLALTNSWVWGILVCALAGRATVIGLRLSGVPNPMPWGRDRNS